MSTIAPAPPTANPNAAERRFRRFLLVFAVVAGLGIVGHLGLLLWAQNSFTGGECVVAAHASMLVHDGTLYYDFHHYPYTVAPYTPLFYLLDAGLQKAGLPIYTAGRVISFAAALGIVGLSWYLTLLYTNDRYSAALSALLCASSSLLWVLGHGWPGGCPGALLGAHGFLSLLSLRRTRREYADLGGRLRLARVLYQADHARMPRGHLPGALFHAPQNDSHEVRVELPGRRCDHRLLTRRSFGRPLPGRYGSRQSESLLPPQAGSCISASHCWSRDR